MRTHAETVLSAILSKENPRRDLLATASARLKKDHFTNSILKQIFGVVIQYFDVTGDVLPSEVFIQKLESKGIDPAQILAFSQKFKELESSPTTEGDFKWSLQELCDEQARRHTGLAITEAMEILERGYEVSGQYHKGHEAAREYLSQKIAEIGHLDQAESTPEGNIYSEGNRVLEQYIKRRDGETAQGIPLGVPTIDQAIGGIERGEMVLVAGFSGTGKSQLVTQAAWHTTVVEKKNVFFATSETVRDQVIRRVLCRHSRLSQFGRPGGLDSAQVRRGLLSEADEQVLRHVVADWNSNPDYGNLNVLQVPRGGTLSYVESKLKEFGRENECDLLIIDYLALLKSEVKRGVQREELNEILKGAKLVATSFNEGQGIPLLSPWQISREGQKAAVVQGFFTLDVLSDTSEAEKSSDGVLSLYREMDNNTSMRIQWLKLRDGTLPPIADVGIDLKSSYIGDQESNNHVLAASLSGNQEFLESLL